MTPRLHVLGPWALLALSIGWGDPALSQSIPQITGWTFSRSSGSGNQNSTAVTSRSDSRGGIQQVLLESENVQLIERPDGSRAYRILDPREKFGSFSEAGRTQERSRSQGLTIFNLGDFGYSVFTN